MLMNSDYDQPLSSDIGRFVIVDKLANITISISHKKLRMGHDSGKPQEGRDRNADLTRARHVICWEPEFSLEERLGITYNRADEMVKK